MLFEDALGGICHHRIELDALDPHPGCVRFVELLFLALLLRHTIPQRVFEFGTLQGRTTLNLALNLPETSRIFTLNLRLVDSHPLCKTVSQLTIAFERTAADRTASASPIRRWFGFERESGC